ncbi:MAG TPA: response regulator [Pyrinomonadaceae bacterium]|jgi:DNA-binding response OmpR family regulator|nr:response regulator [Pyrinomonadaceae bacterium]
MQFPRTRILVVEDHADTRDLLVFMLTDSEYSVETAATLTEAVKLIKEQKFSLLMLDSILPDGDGLDLCRIVRELDKDTPIIFCSGVAYEKDKQEALSAGAQAYFVKPVDLSELIKSVNQLTMRPLSAARANPRSVGSWK